MRIEAYVKANEIHLKDKLLGTSYLDGNKTKNYTIEDLIAKTLEVLTDPSATLSIQADWAQTDDTQANYIKNKPNIYNLPSGNFYRTKGFDELGNVNSDENTLEKGDVIAGIRPDIKRFVFARFEGGDENDFDNNYTEMIGWPIGY